MANNTVINLSNLDLSMDASVIESYLSGLNRFQGQCPVLDSLYQQNVKHIYLYFVNDAFLKDPTQDYKNYRYHNFCFEIVKIKKIPTDLSDASNCYLIKLKFVYVQNLDRLFYIDMRVDRSLLPNTDNNSNGKKENVVARYHERINNHRTSVATDHISHEYTRDDFFNAIRYHMNLNVFV